MLVPLNWLKDYVEIDIPPEELGEMLTMAGLELEALHYRGKDIEDIIIAKIVEVKKHPNADRLSICEVTDGSKTYNIVCGADNMKDNDVVALAPIGSKLPKTDKFPDGLKIKKTKIRGEQSEGMLCAENELGLSDESEGIMILSNKLTLGSKLIDELELDETIFELSITPNRPDCLSIFGIAREVAAILGKDLKRPEFKLAEGSVDTSELFQVNILDSSKCPRYSCRIVEDITVGPSPDWLRNRLEASGIRSINNVVDVTNYVLLEYGQPLHAFDLDLLEGGEINVRAAKEKELLTTLDGQERKLKKNDVLICDAEKAVALGGVMGGLNTEVKPGTKKVLLESAYFDPVTIRKTSKHTGLKSDSSYRFERGVDPNNVVHSLDRAAFLISEIAGGVITNKALDVYPTPINPLEIAVNVDRVKSILGVEIDNAEILDILESLEFEILESKKNNIKLRIPTFRVDIQREIDIVEEIGRLVGYNNIPMVSPQVEMVTGEADPVREMVSVLKTVFISSGYFEAINYSFEDPDLLNLFSDSKTLRLLNPLTNESSNMRTSLLPGLIKDLKLNLSRQVGDIRLFEYGKVYIPKGSGQLPKEETRFAAVATGSGQPELWDKENFNFFDLKNILFKGIENLSLDQGLQFKENKNSFLHPGKSSTVFVEGSELGIIGELHPEYLDKLEIDSTVFLMDLSIDLLSELNKNSSYSFNSIAKYPSVKRDISLIVDRAVTAGEMLQKINGVSKLVEDVWVFDLFEGEALGENKKSVGISILLRSDDKTLTDEDANEVQSMAINELTKTLGAELRTI